MVVMSGFLFGRPIADWQKATQCAKEVGEGGVCFGGAAPRGPTTVMGAVRPDDRAMRFLDADLEELLRMLNLRTFSKRECILDVNAQIANGALDLRVAEQNLHGT